MRPLSIYARAVAVAAHLGLTAGLLWWSSTTLGWLVSALLVPAIPGLLSGREYTYAWMSLMLSFYSAALLAEGVAVPAHKPVAWALAAVAAVEFSALVLYVRLRQRERAGEKLAAAAVSPAAQTAE